MQSHKLPILLGSARPVGMDRDFVTGDTSDVGWRCELPISYAGVV